MILCCCCRWFFFFEKCERCKVEREKIGASLLYAVGSFYSLFSFHVAYVCVCVHSFLFLPSFYRFLSLSISYARALRLGFRRYNFFVANVFVFKHEKRDSTHDALNRSLAVDYDCVPSSDFQRYARWPYGWELCANANWRYRLFSESCFDFSLFSHSLSSLGIS